jgi:hypothetical protein
MWRRVDIVLTDVSGEHTSLLLPAHAGSSLADFLILSSTLKMEAIRSSETSVNAISLQRKVVSLASYPQPGGPGLCIYVPQ